MRSGPDQTAIDLVVERLAACVGVRPETDLVAAGYAVSQNLVAVDLLPGWRWGHSVAPEQNIQTYRQIVGHLSLAVAPSYQIRQSQADC